MGYDAGTKRWRVLLSNGTMAVRFNVKLIEDKLVWCLECIKRTWWVLGSSLYLDSFDSVISSFQV